VSLDVDPVDSVERSHDANVLIVGAGLSGLVAANRLQAHGITSVVLDKGRSAGGRLATRRFTTPAGQGRADHGAQFFTVRSPDFADLVHEWRRAGLVREWCQGFLPGGDGHPRYCAEAGMNTIAKYLSASCHVETDVTATSVLDNHDGSLTVVASDGRQWTGSAVLLSPPVPQSLALLEAGNVVLPETMSASLRTVSYARCLALMVVLDGPSNVPEPGGVQLTPNDDPMFSFVADNHRKGISDVVTLTLHVHDEPSLAMWDADRNETRLELVRAAQRWIGGASMLESQLHGWKFARPVVSHPDACAVTVLTSGAMVGFMGDAFGGAKVEGAALSGLAASEQLLGVQG
jgi:renalase